MRPASLVTATGAGLLAAAAWLPSALAHTAADQPGPAVRHLCAAPTRPGQMACLSVVRTDVKGHMGLMAPDAKPGGLGPSNLQSAYKLPSSSAGSGATVAVVDAQDDPNAESDLATYRSQYGLPACTTANGCFKKVDQNGGTNYPAPDSGWAGEISLDVDMVSAICPNCHILLVEANTANMNDLGAAVNTAVSLGARYVSNSYGGSEDSTDPTSDSQYFDHPGVAITVSSGDSGYGVEYPAASQYVTAVGGTSLRTASNSRGWTETVWNGAGSGCSSVDPKPSWQTDTGCGKRTVADVSAVADPNTGVAVYRTYGGNGWAVYGGTSASAPIIASVYALAGTPAAGSRPARYPYQHTGDLFDVTAGSNGSCDPGYLCTAGTGYDGPSGLGTPNGTAAFAGGSGGAGCTPAQKLGNPGFETGGEAPWSASSGVVSHVSAGQRAHSGSYLAWENGHGAGHTDTLTQSVAIPAGCHARLSFYLHIDTEESTSSTAYDKLTVKAGSTTVATFSNLNHNTGYTRHSYDVSSLAGQTVTISFTGVEDTALQTSFVIDDTALDVS
ncbi:MAG: hypothetical protein ACJ73S_28260 [Mycobacteriales bacterium]